MNSSFKKTIPQELVTHVTAICGEKGEAWFERLQTLIKMLEDRWSVKLDDPFPGIEFNFVAPAVCPDSTPVVIKIAPPYAENEIFSEAQLLRTWAGNGAVELLAEERELNAIMIERAVPGKSLTECFEGKETEAVAPAIDVLRNILKPPPTDKTDVILLDDWFDGLRRYPSSAFPRTYAEKALEIYDSLSVQSNSTFYLHGDFHPGNIVNAVRSPFLAIDPKGMVGHIGYEIAVFLNNFHWWQEGKPDVRNRLDKAVMQFSEAFDLSAAELRQWAFAQMVLGAWWTFDEMPDIYDNEVAKADIWDV